jgi:hypothetical protein
MTTTNIQVRALGSVKITDLETGEIVLEKTNAIHPQNLAAVIARGLAGEDNSEVFYLALGNGGTFYNSSQQLIYRPPSIVGASTLYNQTYQVQVDEDDAGTPTTNSTAASAAAAPSISSIVTVVALLAPNEPSGQAVSDNLTTNPDANFVFDEMGLKSKDGLLLSHLIFSPLEKTANRAFLITYSLTVSAN